MGAYKFRGGIIQKPVPPLIKQKGLTCWAAALASWLTAARDRAVTTEYVLEYLSIATSSNGMLDRRNLDYVTDSLLVRMDFEEITPTDLDEDYLDDLLRWSHLYIIGALGDGISHALVLYATSVVRGVTQVHGMDPQAGYRVSPIREFQHYFRRFIVGYRKGRYGIPGLS